MAITKIQSESLNLADTYDFTGTVTGAGFTNDEFFMAGVNGDQSLSNNTWTKLEFDTLYISNSNYNTSTYRYTVPSGKAGYYHFGMDGNWLSSGDFDNCIIAIRKNGSPMAGSNIRQEHYENHSLSKIEYLNVGDYIEPFAYQQSGGSVSFRYSGGEGSNGFLYGYRIGE